MASLLLAPRPLACTAVRRSQLPVWDFVAPCTTSATNQRSRFHTSRPRESQSTSPQPTPTTSPPSPPPPSPSPSTTSKPLAPLPPSRRAFLTSALRVNQAGELAAVLIYSAQTPILSRSHPHLRPLLSHMAAQESGHYTLFNALISRHRIRPTALTPLWTAAASFLGWSTALMGREAAMACTEAVETAIGTHYNEQVKEMLGWAAECDARGERLGEELEGLVKELRRVRDEELEHLDTAVENDAKMARPYEVLNHVVREGCRGAIWVTERV